MAETVIAEIEKNARESLRMGLSEYRDRHLAYARIWIDTGEKWVPTQKGLTVRVETLPDLIAGLQRVRSEAEAAGLLDPAEQAA